MDTSNEGEVLTKEPAAIKVTKRGRTSVVLGPDGLSEYPDVQYPFPRYVLGGTAVAPAMGPNTMEWTCVSDPTYAFAHAYITQAHSNVFVANPNTTYPFLVGKVSLIRIGKLRLLSLQGWKWSNSVNIANPALFCSATPLAEIDRPCMLDAVGAPQTGVISAQGVTQITSRVVATGTTHQWSAHVHVRDDGHIIIGRQSEVTTASQSLQVAAGETWSFFPVTIAYIAGDFTTAPNPYTTDAMQLIDRGEKSWLVPVEDILANVAALPPGPVHGDRYIITADGTVRTWNVLSGIWEVFTPTEGNSVYVADVDAQYHYTGPMGGWAPV